MGDEPTGNIVIHLDNTIAHYEEDGNRVGTTVFTLDHGSTIFSREDQWILNHENAAPEVVTVSEDGQAIDGFLLADEDGYDSGRLLCPRIRRLMMDLLGGPLIVAVPAAGVVLIARDYALARSCLTQASSEAYDRRPRPLSPEVWRWTDEGLEPLGT